MNSKMSVYLYTGKRVRPVILFSREDRVRVYELNTPNRRDRITDQVNFRFNSVWVGPTGTVVYLKI